MLDVRNLGHAVGERRQIRSAARRLEFAPAVQFFCKRDQVNGLLALAQRDHLRVDAPMLVQEEILGTQILDRGIEGVVIQENRAKDGALRVQVVRKGLLEDGVGRHFSYSLYFRLKYHRPLPRCKSTKKSSGGEECCWARPTPRLLLGDCWAHCARKQGARQREWV